MKKIVSVALIAALTLGITVPRPAHAIIGLATGGGLVIPSLVVMGGSLAAGPAVALAVSKSMEPAVPHSGNSDPFEMIGGIADALVGPLVGIVVSGVGLLVGLVLLDEPSGPALHYAPLTGEHAVALGIDAGAAEQYREELPEINAIAEQVAADLTRQGLAQNHPAHEVVAAAADAWQHYADGISPASAEVVARIGSGLARNVSAHSAPANP